MAVTLAVERRVLIGILGISERAVQRKSRSAVRLTPTASDRLSRIDRILSLATEVFGATEKAAEWLKRSNHGLGKVCETETASDPAQFRLLVEGCGGIGGEWLRSPSACLLTVLLRKPRHAGAQLLMLVYEGPFAFDPRLI